jgi:anti-sigma B factor antagonist
VGLDIGVRQVHDVKVMDLRGALIFGGGVRELRAALRLVEHEGCREILLNLAEVSYIDSSGLGVLVSEFARIGNRNGQMKLLNLTNRVVELLLTTRLYTVFEVFDDEEAAIRSFRERAAGATGGAAHGERSS